MCEKTKPQMCAVLKVANIKLHIYVLQRFNLQHY